MKCVQLKDVFQYKDSDQWLAEEVFREVVDDIDVLLFIQQGIHQGKVHLNHYIN